jgi:hypothetical protein
LPFGFGWALLAVLSVRFSDQPQWWAAAPAVFFGLIGGLMLIWPNRLVLDALGWVWPPALLGLVVLMIIGAHRRLRSRTREWLVYPLLVALTLAALGGGYETVQDHSAVAQLIDVGGHRLHLQCTGSGSPTVVLEPGLGETSSVMGWIAPAIAGDTRVFSPVRYAVQAEGRQNPNHVRAGRSPIDAAYSQAPRSSAWQMTNVLVEAPVATCVES